MYFNYSLITPSQILLLYKCGKKLWPIWRRNYRLFHAIRAGFTYFSSIGGYAFYMFKIILTVLITILAQKFGISMYQWKRDSLFWGIFDIAFEILP